MAGMTVEFTSHSGWHSQAGRRHGISRRILALARLYRRRLTLMRANFALGLLDARTRADVGLPERLPLERAERLARMFMMR